MADLALTFIGSGNTFAPGGLCWNGFVVDGKHLFEAPPTALMALNRLSIDPNEIETVVISHHHGDHILGIPFLLLHWKFFGRTKPVRIIGPRGTRDLAMSITQSVYPGTAEASLPIEWVEALPGQSMTAGGIEIETLAMKHDERLADCLGFLCRYRGATIGYTGDTAMCDSVRDLARQSDLLVSECATRDEVIPVHMNLFDDIPVVRGLLRAEAPLLLTHLSPGVDGAGLANTYVAEDFKTYRFSDLLS